MTGRTLGHYQVLEPLGSGGMGEVFKARDTRLNRMVAIKVLRPEFLSEARRKQRFIQEAQAASALNHPNIVTIHDIDEQQGVDFMVMEYIAGRTLDARIPRQGMPRNEALRVAVQIAEGLRRAHAAGIVHRDLKPSNIMLADDGHVKILDFGLAKLTEKSEISEDDATRTKRLETEEGTVLGTTAYMSPEQAEGRKLDARTDIFSFGVVLYEMLAGHKPFDGTSQIAIMSAILKEEPKPIENIHPQLEWLLRRCLRKDRDKRFQHMDDLRLALDDIREDSQSTFPARVIAAPTRSRLPWILAAAVLVAGLAAGFAWKSRETPPAAYHLRQITADSGLTTTPAISPDGRLLAYASDRGSGTNLDIWVHPLAPNAQPIRITTHDSDDSDPTFSPDGGQLAFYSRREGGGIYVVSALGGQERLLIRGAGTPRYSPNGQWLAYSTNAARNPTRDSAVMVLPVTGGSPRRIAPEIGWSSSPVWSPDSNSIVFLAMKNTTAQSTRSVWRAPADGGPATRLYDFVPDRPFPIPEDWQGESVLAAFGTELRGINPARPEQSTLLFTATGRVATSRAAADRIVFSSNSNQRRLWSVLIDHHTGRPRGAMEPLPYSGGAEGYPSVSDDGTKLVFSHFEPTRSELRLRDLASRKERVLHTKPSRGAISPDGSRVAFGDFNSISIMDAAGGQASNLVEKNSVLFRWTPDGRSLLYYKNNGPMLWFTVDPVSRESQESWTDPKRNIHSVRPSPDGRWVAFHVPDDPKQPVVVAPFRNGRVSPESEWIRVVEGNVETNYPWWSPDGNLVYWVSDQDGFACVWARRLAPVSMRPIADPFAVIHLHEARRSLAGVGIAGFGPALTRDQLIFALPEVSGNIWLAEREAAK